MKNISVLEDDSILREQLSHILFEEGFHVHSYSNCHEIRKGKNKSDLIIIDWRLPDGQGIDILKEFRQNGFDGPIIMLTARNELLDKIIGLESGANDYITKPFEPKELIARVRAHLRFSGLNIKDGRNSRAKNQKIIINDLCIEDQYRQVKFKSKKIDLTKKEYDLLYLMAHHPNRVFSRDELLNKVWGYENFPTTRTVDTHILQLRQKISEDYFETFRGVGYQLKLTET